MVEGVAENAGDNALFLDVKLAVAVLAVNDISRVNVTVAVAALEAFVVVFVVIVPVVFVAAVIVMISVAVVFPFDDASIVVLDVLVAIVFDGSVVPVAAVVVFDTASVVAVVAIALHRSDEAANCWPIFLSEMRSR